MSKHSDDLRVQAKAIANELRLSAATGVRATLTAEQAKFILYNTDLAAWENGAAGDEAKEPHCVTCICGKRAPVQDDRGHNKGAGTISWEEHCEAWGAYSARYGASQSAERVAERGGFSYGELLMFLKREPTTWRPR